ncbi:pilus assembly protein [Marinobacter salinisoli]|uniref:Pilus assembly protein n=1 Tax=Marinobacter salinisoli TaxID=2769486 RepID=A0ABX7MUR5_9GAMM|nr:PilX N-terminal domain-containing pilus assembly protein [Marinobacter salinisoli]QSP96127.1 pilus assembly protein [Marinobacter salinisoli]
MMASTAITKKRQQGAALLTSLLILLILSLLAVSSMQNSSMQERMVSAHREGYMAMEGAELALREAERAIDALASPSGFNAIDGFYDIGDAPRGVEIFDPDEWAGNKSVTVTVPTVGGAPLFPESPRYIVEYIGDAQLSIGGAFSDINVTNYTHETGASVAKAFRIIAKGTGATGAGQRILEEYYRRDF